MAVLVMPIIASTSLAEEWIVGSFSIEIYGYCSHILAGTSPLTVTLVAVNRYLRVVRPTLYLKLFSKKNSTVMAVTTWIVSTVAISVGFPVLGVQFRPSLVNVTLLKPVFSNTSALIFFNVLHGLLIGVAGIIIIACHVKIYQTIRHHNTAAAPSSQEGHSSYGVEKEKITRILTIVVIGFYVCWFPPFVSRILMPLKLIGRSGRKYGTFYHIFPALISSAINPLIYATMCPTFRKEFLKIVRGQFCSGNHIV